MLIRLILCLLCCLSVASCGPRYNYFTRYHEDGRSKPTILVTRIQNLSKADLKWNLAQELQQDLVGAFLRGEKVYLDDAHYAMNMSQNELQEMLLKESGRRPEWLEEDYVIFLELLEHKEIPYDGSKTEEARQYKGVIHHMLRMKMRINVIDVKHYPTQVVLQETYVYDHLIPSESEKVDYKKFTWGSYNYPYTPYNVAHQRLMQGVARRVEGYITARQSMR